GRLEEALATARRIGEIAPDDIGNQERILRIHFELRDTDGVLTTAASLAELYWSAGDKERVKNMYKLVLELVPEDIEIRKKLINLYLDANDRDGAADEYEAIASIMERRGNTAGLYEIYQKISRLAPHRKDLLRRLKGRSDKPVVRIPRSPFHFLKRLIKWVAVLAVLGGIGGAVWWELKARREAKPLFEEAERHRTEGKYDEADETLNRIEKTHPYTLLRFLDLPGKREEVAKSRAEEQQRIDKVEGDKKAKRRQQWEEIEAGEAEIRKNNAGELLLEKLAILQKEIEAYLAMGEDDEYTKKASAWIEARKTRLEEAEAILGEAKKLEAEDRRLAEGRKIRRRLQEEYDDTPAAQNVLIPYQILSVPPGATVTEGGKALGKTPCLLYANLDGSRRPRMFKIRKDGYFPTELELDADLIEDRTDFKVTLKRRPLWTFATGEPIEAPPAVLGPMVYTGSRTGYLYAVDTRRVDPEKPGTWRAAWQFKHPDPRRVGLGGIVHAPVAVEDLVIYPHTDSYLYAVRNGAEAWSYSLGPGNTIIGSPIVADKRVVIGVGAGRRGSITCFPLSPRGAQRPWWQFPAGGRPDVRRLSVPPILDADASPKRIFFTTTRGKIFGLDLNSGHQVASFDLQETVACPMAMQAGVLYVVTQDWVVRAVDFNSPPPYVRWTFPVGKPVKAGLLIHSNRLVVCPEREKGKGQVIVLDTRDRTKAEVKWDFKTDGPILATPVVDQNRLYIGSHDRHLYALFFWEGKLAWSFSALGRINGLVVRESIIYATTEEGDLFAVKGE
ncbi:MAG: outer membrane protein assembly factor BamB family protein, partial [Planctomycetota bacterium]